MTNQFKVNQLIFDGPNKLSQRAFFLDHVESKDALFETLYTTICGSDLRILLHGDSRICEPRVLGHEVVAKVIYPGIRPNLTQGDIVAIGADIPCGKCKFCIGKRENLCTEHVALGYQIDGGLSSIIRFPANYLLEAPIVRVNPKNYIEAYALAEPVGCVIHGIEFSQVESTNRLLILGGGPIGIMLIKVCLDLIGIPKHQITVIEPFSSRRNFVLGMGIDAFPSIIDLPKVGNRLFDRIFTATSNPTSHDGIFEFIEKGGRVNFFGGVPKNSSQIQLDANLLHYSEISLEGSHGSSPRHHEKATNLISLDEEFWAKLITTKTSLHGLPSAISRMRQGLELKVAVDFKNGS